MGCRRKDAGDVASYPTHMHEMHHPPIHRLLQALAGRHRVADWPAGGDDVLRPGAAGGIDREVQLLWCGCVPKWVQGGVVELQMNDLGPPVRVLPLPAEDGG